MPSLRQIDCPHCGHEGLCWRSEPVDCQVTFLCWSCGFKSDNKASEETVAQRVFPEFKPFIKYVKTEDFGVLPWWPAGLDAGKSGLIIPLVLSGKLKWRRLEIPTTPEAKANYTIRTAIFSDYKTFKDALEVSVEQNRVRSSVRKLRNRRLTIRLLSSGK